MISNIYIVEDRRLRVDWVDGASIFINIKTLRTLCPCADCKKRREKGSKNSSPLRVVEKAEGDPLKIKEIHLVGRYAINVVWEDGHKTGIYPFEFLKKLAEKHK